MKIVHHIDYISRWGYYHHSKEEALKEDREFKKYSNCNHDITEKYIDFKLDDSSYDDYTLHKSISCSKCGLSWNMSLKDALKDKRLKEAWKSYKPKEKVR